MAASWARTGALLRRYYPLWRLEPNVPGGPAFGELEPLRCEGEPGGDQIVAFRLHLPLEHLGASGPAPLASEGDYPDGLWPLQLSLTLCLRLRMLGWWAELGWPGSLLLDGEPIGRVRTGRDERRFHAEIDIAVGKNRGAKIPPKALEGAACGVCTEGLAISLAQSAVAVLESPWPRRRMLGFYQDWCPTLGTRIAGVTREGLRAEGIACGVKEDGSMSVESLGGKISMLVAPWENSLEQR